MDLKDRIADELVGARDRSLSLLAPLSDEELVRRHSPLMSPLVWDLAHVGNYEDQWLVRALGAPGLGNRYDELYDAFLHPRRTRSALPLLGPDEARGYIAAVRNRVLDTLDRARFDVGEQPLLHDGFVYRMVVEHEHQHVETMLATLQLMDDPPSLAPAVLAGESGRIPVGFAGRNGDSGDVVVPGGPFVMGTDTDPWAYDNERPAHVVDLPPFRIDIGPVTNAAYAEFVDAGGYDDPRWWTADGWKWRQEAALAHPQFWQRDGTWWLRRRFGVVEPVPGDEPVQHVCWYEADAYARWRGKRLPTEAEWEKASSAVGCLGTVGHVWEWTASDFTAYPGFRAFPYREYSEVFFGTEYKVLRGGSWATHSSVFRPTFRNWDYPIRRQIFAGFRCAQDV